MHLITVATVALYGTAFASPAIPDHVRNSISPSQNAASYDPASDQAGGKKPPAPGPNFYLPKEVHTPGVNSADKPGKDDDNGNKISHAYKAPRQDSKHPDDDGDDKSGEDDDDGNKIPPAPKASHHKSFEGDTSSNDYDTKIKAAAASDDDEKLHRTPDSGDDDEDDFANTPENRKALANVFELIASIPDHVSDAGPAAIEAWLAKSGYEVSASRDDDTDDDDKASSTTTHKGKARLERRFGKALQCTGAIAGSVSSLTGPMRKLGGFNRLLLSIGGSDTIAKAAFNPNNLRQVKNLGSAGVSLVKELKNAKKVVGSCLGKEKPLNADDDLW